MTLEYPRNDVVHFGNPLSNFLVPLNIFRMDEATHYEIS